MTDRSSKVYDLHPPGDRPGLRGQAAEILIQATDPVQAGHALFELIAAELKLNAFLLHVTGAAGHLELIAQGGLSEAETAIATAHTMTAAASGAPVRIPLTGHITGVQEMEDGATFLGSLGIRAWFGEPLMAGERLLGVLGFGRRWADRFQDEDLAFLQCMAHYFALALERLRGEAALHESEQRLRLGMEVAGFGTLDFNLVSGQIVVSPEIFTITGLSPDQPVTVERLRNTVHPDDRERVRVERLAVYDPEGAGYYSSEYRIVRPDGTVRWVNARAQAFFAGEAGARQTVRVIAVQRDITESKLAAERLRESEQRLQLAQELGGVASFEWRPEGFWVSESYRRIYGLPPGSPVDDDVTRSLTHPDDRERVAANARKVLETGESEECEYRIIRPSDRQERWIWTVWGASQDPFSGAKRLVGIALDITERKRNEERELLLSREVDHRAKNLLSVVQSMVQLTRADSIPEFVDQVKGRIHALGRVHSLLAASRWEGAELSKLIEEELAAFADDGDRLRLEGPLVALRPAAAQSMALVIHELATNAAKYGALSVVGGHVEVIWDAGETVAGGLVLRWRENEGPPVVPPEQTGFGMKSIRASIERQLGGTLDLQWHPEGLQCELVLPSRQLVPG